MKENKSGFFRFPNAKKHPKMSQRWIHACKRKNTDGTEWQPKSFIFVVNL